MYQMSQATTKGNQNECNNDGTLGNTDGKTEVTHEDTTMEIEEITFDGMRLFLQTDIENKFYIKMPQLFRVCLEKDWILEQLISESVKNRTFLPNNVKFCNWVRDGCKTRPFTEYIAKVSECVVDEKILFKVSDIENEFYGFKISNYVISTIRVTNTWITKDTLINESCKFQNCIGYSDFNRWKRSGFKTKSSGVKVSHESYNQVTTTNGTGGKELLDRNDKEVEKIPLTVHIYENTEYFSITELNEKFSFLNCINILRPNDLITKNGAKYCNKGDILKDYPKFLDFVSINKTRHYIKNPYTIGGENVESKILFPRNSYLFDGLVMFKRKDLDDEFETTRNHKFEFHEEYLLESNDESKFYIPANVVSNINFESDINWNNWIRTGMQAKSLVDLNATHTRKLFGLFNKYLYDGNTVFKVSNLETMFGKCDLKNCIQLSDGEYGSDDYITYNDLNQTDSKNESLLLWIKHNCQTPWRRLDVKLSKYFPLSLYKRELFNKKNIAIYKKSTELVVIFSDVNSIFSDNVKRIFDKSDFNSNELIDDKYLTKDGLLKFAFLSQDVEVYHSINKFISSKFF